jgi:hypothetical protein
VAQWDIFGNFFMATGSIPYFRAGSFGTQIKIGNKSGTVTPIEHSSAYQAYKTLGVYQAATKHQKVPFQILQTKAASLLCNLALHTCSANAAWLRLICIFMKGIGSHLSRIQLKKLQGPITALMINQLGYPKALSRAVVFGSLEFALLETTQGAGKIQLLLRHLCTPGQPNHILLVVIDGFQYNAGV